MIEILVCICAFCVDGFCVSISLKATNVKLSLQAMCIIALMNALFLSISVVFSSYFLSFVGIGKYLSSILYLGIGLYIYVSYRIRSIYGKEDRFLSTIKEKVQLRDAFLLGLLLSFDSLISGMVLVDKHYTVSIYFMLDFIFSVLSLIIGSYFGRKLAHLENFESEVFTSSIFIILAIIKLF